jgi:hypothetical protein
VKLDILAGEVQFVHHLAPVWHALPVEVRGDFIVWPSPHSSQPFPAVIAAAEARGIRPVLEPTDPSRPVLVTSYGDHTRATRTRRRHIARMEHGIGQSFITSNHPSYAGGRNARDVSLFLTPNEHSADRWRRAYRSARVEVIGCPKLDTLPHRVPGPGPVIATSFHWGIATVRSHHPLTETRGSWHEYRRAVLDLAGAFDVIGTGHPKIIERMSLDYASVGIPVVRDFADVLRHADVLVCDTNSALYEFASTGRPVVVVNGRHFRRTIRHGLRFDWGPVTNVGVQCDSPAGLPDAIRAALAGDHHDAREEALSIVYRHRTGAARRAADVLVDWIGERASIAA